MHQPTKKKKKKTVGPGVQPCGACVGAPSPCTASHVALDQQDHRRKKKSKKKQKKMVSPALQCLLCGPYARPTLWTTCTNGGQAACCVNFVYGFEGALARTC